jgi:hypothetical protein
VQVLEPVLKVQSVVLVLALVLVLKESKVQKPLVFFYFQIFRKPHVSLLL